MLAADSIPGQLTDACDEVRLADPTDAVAGVQPRFVAAPASTAQASAVLTAAAELGLAVIPRGSGSRLDWGAPPERADLIVETARLTRVIEHEAGDLVASVETGVTLGQLASVLAGAGQRLALDLPGDGSGTIGGALATGVAGPLRLRYGSPRDLLIGITIVRADGTIARSGGKVVKNVAGYDLGKLFAGSRGTLGLITEATFRLHPLPQSTAYVSAECDSPQTCERLLAAAMAPQLAPVAAELSWPQASAPIALGIALEGDPAGVTQRATQLSELLAQEAGAVVSVSDSPPPWWRSGPAAQPDGTVLQLAFWPGELLTVLTELRSAAERAALDPAVAGSAAAGVLHAAVPATSDAKPGQIAGLVTSLRDQLSTAPARSSVLIQHAPAAVTELADPFGPVPALRLMRAIKQQFDPARMMSPGRFAGGL
ncbi:MAG TPA: FAD-binding oxidoreductase [Streptosporangiaceae bacterium]|nr:FAD-binding oxidoreductase [Streptosporangiaceae bacterium]